MGIKQGFLVELDHETNNTRRVLERVTDEHLNYKPHEKSMTLGNLLGHVVELHNWVADGLPQDEFNLATDYKPFKQTSVAEIKDALESGYTKNKETVENMSEEEWMKTWTLKAGDHVISQVPKIGAFRFIVYNHLIHHRGQLNVYLRLLDIPVPGIYGPSADEKM